MTDFPRLYSKHIHIMTIAGGTVLHSAPLPPQGTTLDACCVEIQVTADRNLPPLFKERIQHLQSAHGVTSMPVRKIPPEFKEVFSDLCVVNMPRDGAVSVSSSTATGAFTLH